MGKLAITGARLIDPASGYDALGGLLIEDGVITGFGEDIVSADCDTIDADGMILCPGLIDMRVSTGEPGAEHKETIESAGKAAVAGGVTSVVLMPTTNPVIDDISLVDHMQRRGRESTDIRIYTAGALTKGLAGREMTELGLMSEAGAVLFCNGETPITDARLMRRIMSYGSTFNALIVHRAIDANLSDGACAHESDFSARLGLPSAPAMSERIMVERDIALAELTGARTLIDLVSAGEALPPIQRAKQRGLDISASVSINHLALNELDIGDYRSFAKLDPPLRGEDDRAALVAGVNDGSIDIVVSSHDPRPAGEKRKPFEQSAAGAVGLELLLSAGLTLVADGQLELTAFLKAVTINPAELLGLPQGRLAVDAPADLVLIDPDKPWVCSADDLRSKSKNTPFDGRHMQGKAVMTICAGDVVFNARSA